MPSDTFNLGSGSGFSVREVINAAERVVGQKIETKSSKRRPGDVTQLVASFTKAHKTLGWKPKATLEHIIQTAWDFERRKNSRKNEPRQRPWILGEYPWRIFQRLINY